MKIKPEHYREMLSSIRQVIERIGRSGIAKWKHEVKRFGNYGDFDRRIRWDLFNAAGLHRYACRTLYGYADDNHIDTALRRIMKKLKV